MSVGYIRLAAYLLKRVSADCGVCQEGKEGGEVIHEHSKEDHQLCVLWPVFNHFCIFFWCKSPTRIWPYKHLFPELLMLSLKFFHNFILDFISLTCVVGNSYNPQNLFTF